MSEQMDNNSLVTTTNTESSSNVNHVVQEFASRYNRRRQAVQQSFAQARSALEEEYKAHLLYLSQQETKTLAHLHIAFLEWIQVEPPELWSETNTESRSKTKLETSSKRVLTTTKSWWSWNMWPQCNYTMTLPVRLNSTQTLKQKTLSFDDYFTAQKNMTLEKNNKMHRLMNVQGPDMVDFVYSIQNAPWFFTTPSYDDVKYFETRVQICIRRCFDSMRQNAQLSAATVVAPDLGGISAGEIAILWIQSRYVRRHNTYAKKLQKLSKTRKTKGFRMLKENPKKFHKIESLICLK